MLAGKPCTSKKLSMHLAYYLCKENGSSSRQDKRNASLYSKLPAWLFLGIYWTQSKEKLVLSIIFKKQLRVLSTLQNFVSIYVLIYSFIFQMLVCNKNEATPIQKRQQKELKY